MFGRRVDRREELFYFYDRCRRAEEHDRIRLGDVAGCLDRLDQIPFGDSRFGEVVGDLIQPPDDFGPRMIHRLIHEDIFGAELPLRENFLFRRGIERL